MIPAFKKKELKQEHWFVRIADVIDYFHFNSITFYVINMLITPWLKHSFYWCLSDCLIIDAVAENTNVQVLNVSILQGVIPVTWYLQQQKRAQTGTLIFQNSRCHWLLSLCRHTGAAQHHTTVIYSIILCCY